MSEPPGQMPATAGHGDFRASHADREQVIGTLKAAFVQGRLARDEFDLRAGQALASRTYAELAAVTADLPAGLTAAQPSNPARAPGERLIVRRPGPVLTVATVLYAGMWPLAFVVPRNGEGDPVAGVSLVATVTLAYFLVLITACAWAQAPGSRRDKRPGGQLPVRPAPIVGGQAPARPSSVDQGGQLPPVDPDHPHTAKAVRRRLPCPPLPVHGHCAGGALAAGPARS